MASGASSWKVQCLQLKGARFLLSTYRLRAETVLRREIFVKTFKSGIFYQVLVSCFPKLFTDLSN